jgi:hypothetical protein
MDGYLKTGCGCDLCGAWNAGFVEGLTLVIALLGEVEHVAPKREIPTVRRVCDAVDAGVHKLVPDIDEATMALIQAKAGRQDGDAVH